MLKPNYILRNCNNFNIKNNIKNNLIIKRCFHPGFSNNKKLTLPLCPPNLTTNYYEPVWGNKIQELQINNYKNKNSYKTNKINNYSNIINNKFNNQSIFLHTSHSTPIETAFNSCRNINTDKFLKHLYNLNITNENGIFINNSNNRNKLLTLVNYCENKKEKNILKTAIFGIFSNFADSIYIANDYLAISNQHIIIANYPDLVSQREVERSRIIANSLINGNYPIILDNNITFEGEANIKFIPAYIYEDNITYQLCFTYDSSRSNINCINNINKYLKKLNKPLLKPIKLKPKKGLEKFFYHQDCIINFCCDNEYQYFKNIDDFWNNYKKNGIAIVVKNAFDSKYNKKLENIFKKIIYVNKEEDLLCANMIVSNEGIIGSSKINNYDEIKKEFPFFHRFIHPSFGGGGAHKCCSNVIFKNKELNIDDWLEFSQSIGSKINNNLIIGVKNEINRIKNIKI